ncbi:MAG: lysylphosphatidylglycerol synthase transmembrane domain-containing protein [Spirochaetia bacterium]
MKRKISKPIKIVIEVLLLAGIVALFIVVLDPQQLKNYLLRVTLWSILGLLAFQFAIHIIGAAQWVVLLRESGIRANPWRVFWARLSGCAITSLTPSAYFGGEPVRAAMLKDESMNYRQLFATIAVDKYIELFTKFPIAVTGFGCLIFLAHPSQTLVIISSFFVAFFFAIFFLIMVKLFQGGDFIMRFFKRILRPLTKFRPRLAVKIIHPIRGFTRSVAHLFKSRRAFYLAMSLGILLSVAELFQYTYVLSVLGIFSVPDAAIIFFGHVFLGIFSFIPGNVGSMEGVFLFVFALLGLGSDRSLIFSMIMRIGQLVMVALGVANIMVSRIRKRVGKGADRNRTDA